MSSRKRKTRRNSPASNSPRQQPVSEQQPGYPSLREHLLTRRDVLGFLGATVMTGLTLQCCGGKRAGPRWHTYRLPREEDTTIPLNGGGAIRCYFNAVSEMGYFQEGLALDLLEHELSLRSYAELAAIHFSDDVELLREFELELADAVSGTEPWADDFVYIPSGSLTLTILELIQ